MKKWTKIFNGASYLVEKGRVTISTYRNGGHVVALTRLHTPSTFYWTGESDRFRYYTLRKSNNGIYPIYVISLNKQNWMVINRIRFGIVGESITVRPYTIFTDFADGSDADAIVAGFQKKGLNLSEGNRDNRKMLKNLAETVLFLRQVIAGKEDIKKYTPHDDNGNGKLDEKTIKKVAKERQKELVA